MKVAVVVLNWNGKSDTLECLESLNDSTHRDLAIIVVDNGSVDGSPEALRQACPHATVMAARHNPCRPPSSQTREPTHDEFAARVRCVASSFAAGAATRPSRVWHSATR